MSLILSSHPPFLVFLSTTTLLGGHIPQVKLLSSKEEQLPLLLVMSTVPQRAAFFFTLSLPSLWVFSRLGSLSSLLVPYF